MNIGNHEEEANSLPRFQEVVAVITHSAVLPVGPLGDQDLQLVFEVLEGPSKGQRITQYVPLWSRDEDTRIRGRVVLRVLCNALGVDQPLDSAELHGKPLVLHLSRKRGSEDRPYAQYLRCEKSDREAWERWAKRAVKEFNEKAQRTLEESERAQ
jgi:hypothetical protein